MQQVITISTKNKVVLVHADSSVTINSNCKLNILFQSFRRESPTTTTHLQRIRAWPHCGAIKNHL